MKNFSRPGSDRGGRDFGKKSFPGRGFGGGGRSFGGDRGGDRGDRQMFSATCSKCGKDAQLPFRPSGDRPVFCSNCFETEKNSAPSFGGGSSFSRPPRDFGRPGFGDRRPPAPHAAPAVNLDQFKAQFEALNAKLDRLIRAIAPKEAVEVEEKAPKASLGKSKSAPVAAKPAKKAAAKKKK